jgi:NMD protein affecting ribosome stability and mRNA decay
MTATHSSVPICFFAQPFALPDEEVHDPYQICSSLYEPSVCGDCKAVYLEGRWQWTTSPVNAHRIRCPACRRIHDKLAAGHVSIEGRFAREYRDELRLLAQTLETRMKLQHPMQRIMSIEEQPDGLLITTTDVHLARSIGEALNRAYKGNLDFHYNETKYLLRVRWQRWA